MKRIITALALLPLAFYAIFWAPMPIFIAVVAVMAALCYREFDEIAQAQGIAGPLWIGYLIGALILADAAPLRMMGALLLATAMSLRDLAKATSFAGVTLLGIIYVFGAWRCAIDLRELNPFWILFALAVNWVGDVAAFYVGKNFGRHRLAPRISPAKSWEGAVGSMVMSLVFGYAFHWYVQPRLPLPHVLLLAVISNVAGQVGDLAESAMKRGAGVKDSGTLLPGHGGFLDRLDSSLFTMPIAYYYLRYFGLTT